MIKLKNIYKTYDNKTFALDDISLNIEQGQIISLLGHNGAGKSTLLKIIATILAPTKGEVWFGDISLIKASQNQLRKIKRNIGFLTEDSHFYNNLTPCEYLSYVGQLYGIGNDTLLKSKINNLINLFNIDNSDIKFIESYSSGLKKRIALAAVIINEPKLIILDEPTNNLDPIGVKLFKELVKKMKREGVSIIFATHQLEIAEKLSDDIVVIEQGKVKFTGTITLLENRFNTSKINRSLENLYAILTKEEVSFE